MYSTIFCLSLQSCILPGDLLELPTGVGEALELQCESLGCHAHLFLTWSTYGPAELVSDGFVRDGVKNTLVLVSNSSSAGTHAFVAERHGSVNQVSCKEFLTCDLCQFNLFLCHPLSLLSLGFVMVEGCLLPFP